MTSSTDKLFLNIVSMSQENLHLFLRNYLRIKGYKNIQEHKTGFLYAPGDIPFMLVAHLDTVHHQLPKNVFFDNEQQVMWSPQGIGGDDRAGVYGILKVLEKCKPHVLFLHDEEIGGVGASIATRYLDLPDVNFMIEFDRKGKDDAVFYDCGNEVFKEHILSFGFKEQFGSFSDISVLSPEWDIASVNLSIGYYNAHTTNEFIRVNEVNEVVEKTIKILENSDHNTLYDFQEIKYSYGGWYYEDDLEDFHNKLSIEDLNKLFGIQEIDMEDVKNED